MLQAISFRVRIALTMLIISLVVFVLASIVTDWLIAQTLRQNGQQVALEYANTAAHTIEGRLMRAAETPRILATLADTFDGSPAERRPWFERTIAALLSTAPADIYDVTTFFEPQVIPGRDYATVWYIRGGPQGRPTPLTINIPGDPGYDSAEPLYNYFEQDWYRQAMENETLQWSEPYFDAGGAEVTMVTASMQAHDDGRIIGVSTVDVTLDEIVQLMDEVRPTSHSYTMLISRDGSFIAHSLKPDLSLDNQLDQVATELNSPELAELNIALSLGQTGSMALRDPFRAGEPSLAAYTQISQTGWSVVVVVSESDIFAPLVQLRRVLIPILLSLAVILSALSWIFASRLLRPVALLASSAKRIAAGDYTTPIPGQGPDEIGMLARGLEYMLEQIALGRTELEHQVQERTSELRHSLNEQFQQAQKLAEAMDQLQQREEQLHALGMPVVPVLNQMLVMPIIGSLDEKRVRRINETLLQTVNTRQAQVVVLDVTGLITVDIIVAKALLATTRSLRLLGARVILVGVRPEVAQTLVALDVSLDDLPTMSDLQAAVMQVLHANRLKIED